ncbi:glutathione S-transferase [Ectothiorhodospiraceae bacterium WFHF3C12]|nr:glutathione S-transferase [Ectothiorhodospiraceae bacterium WFHF3C12]
MADERNYTLYGTEFSLYTGKVRAYLRYKGIPYKEVLSTMGVYERVIVPNTGVRMIPVVQTPSGEFIQDTTEIIDALEARFPERGIYPETPRQRLASLLIELYADEWLLIPAMHYRWSFPEQNERFIMAEFGKVAAPWAPAFIRRALARKRASFFSGMLPVLGISKETGPAIEQWYESLLDHLEQHFSRHRYALGERASMADFGLIAPLYAHLYRDPAPGRIMRERAPSVARWVERMFEDQPAIGEWLPGDEVPDTLLPILRHQFREQFPVLRETVETVADYVSEHPGERVRRRVGQHRFRIGDAEGERAVMAYPQWMLQRALDYYNGLAGADREAAEQLLDAAGGREAMGMEIPRRLVRRNNQLWPA